MEKHEQTSPQSLNEQNQQVISQQESAVFSKVFKVAAYPVSFLAGAIAAKTHIDDSAYNELKKRGVFDDIQAEHVEKLAEISNSAKEAYNRTHIPQDILKATTQEKTNYSQKVETRIKEFDLDNTVKKWKLINKSDRQGAVQAAFMFSGIAVGALLSIADSKVLTYLFDRKDTSKENSRD